MTLLGEVKNIVVVLMAAKIMNNLPSSSNNTQSAVETNDYDDPATYTWHFFIYM